MKRIYIAGPYTKGDVAINVRNALEMADRIANAGMYPFVPHLTHFWHMMFPRCYQSWLEIDIQFVIVCHAVIRIPGESSGADGELKVAGAHGIPIFYDFESLLRWVNDGSR